MTRLRCLTYNIDGGPPAQLEHLLTVLTPIQADIIALTEANDEAVVAQLAARLKLTSRWARGSGDRHIAVLARFPIRHWQAHHKPPLTQAALEVKLALPGDQTLTIYNLHLLPYLFWPFEVRRWQAVGRLLAIIHAQPPGPHLIVGDLNAIAPGDRVLQHHNPPRMRRVQALQFNLIIRLALPRLLQAGYADCFRQLHPTDDGFTWMPRNRTTRYDYILADAPMRQRLRACRVVDDLPAVALASDHLPLLAEFDLNP